MNPDYQPSTQQGIPLPIGQQAAFEEIPFTQELITKDDAGFGGFLSTMLSGIILLGVLMTLLYLLWGGIEWITAGGDKGKVEKARDKITQSVIGLVVLGASVAILMVVQSFLGVNLLKFSGGNPAASGGGSGFGGSSGSGGGSGLPACTSSTVGRSYNDGGAGGYCTQGAATVRCQPGDGHLPYPHFDPCSCSSGSQYQVSGYDFSSC